MKIDRIACSGVPYGVAWPGGPWTTVANIPPGAGEDVLAFDVSVDGRIAGQGQTTGLVKFWNGTTWQNLGSAFGVRTCAFDVHTGNLYVSEPGDVAVYALNGARIDTLPTPPGSQGIRYIAPGSKVMTGDMTMFDGLVHEWTEIDAGIRIGQGSSEGLVAEFGGKAHLITHGAPYFIFVKQVGNDVAITYAQGNENIRVLTTIQELLALPELIVVTDPPPVVIPPINPPEVPPVSIPSQLEAVQNIRRQYPTPLGTSHPSFLIEVSSALGAKLLAKHGGTVVTLPDGRTCSQDIIVFGTTGVDILSDGEGAATPSWSVKEGETFTDLINPQDYKHPGPVPVPTPVPTPGPDYGAQIQALAEALHLIAQTVDGFQENLAQVGGAINQLSDRVKFLENRLSQKVRTTPAGYGPLKHSHEVSF